MGPPRTPPIPASAAPMQKTTVKRRGTAMPRPRAISMSSTPARIIAPIRVRSSKTQRTAATTTEIATTASRYFGKKMPKRGTAPESACGMGSGIGSPDQMRSEASPMMKAMPRVMSTWGSVLPARRRKRNRSARPPSTAMARPPRRTAGTNPRPARRAERPTYAPSMKKAPCARFATRMSPKMSEKPEERRKRSPPSARPFSDWMRKKRTPCSLLEVLRFREAPRVDRALEELLGLPLPELAHVRIRLHHRVDEPSVLPLHLADVDGEVGIPELVHAHGAAEAVLHVERPERLHEGVLVLDVALHFLESEIEEEHGGICARAVVAGIRLVLLAEGGHELLVFRVVDGCAVPAAGDDADRFVAHVLQDALVDRRHVAQHRNLPLEPVLGVLAQEAQPVRAGEAGIDGVDVGLDLADVGSVVGDVERRPELLDHLAAVILESTLEAGGGLVAEGEVVADGGDAFVLEHLGRVLAQGVVHLRRGAHRADEPRVEVALAEILGRRGGRDHRHLRLLDVVVDGQGLEGGERPDDGVHLVTLDRLLRAALGGGGLSRGVERDHFDLAPRKLPLVLIEVEGEPFLHLTPACGEGSGLHGEEPDPDGALVRRRLQRAEDCEGEGGAPEDDKTEMRQAAARPGGQGVGHGKRSPPAPEMSRERRAVDLIYHEDYTVNPLPAVCPDARFPSAPAHRHLPEAARGNPHLRAS